MLAFLFLATLLMVVATNVALAVERQVALIEHPERGGSRHRHRHRAVGFVVHDTTAGHGASYRARHARCRR